MFGKIQSSVPGALGINLDSNQELDPSSSTYTLWIDKTTNELMVDATTLSDFIKSVASQITVDTSGFTLNLSSSDTDVQTALNTLDLVTTAPGGSVGCVQYQNPLGVFSGTSLFNYASSLLQVPAITTTGNITAGNTLVTNATTESSSISTGALQSQGGLGVAKRIYAGGRIYAQDTSTCSSLGIGSVVVSGGVSIQQNIKTGTSIAAGSYITAGSYIKAPSNDFAPASSPDSLVRLIAWQGYNGESHYKEFITPTDLDSSGSAANIRFSTTGSGEIFISTSSRRYKTNINDFKGSTIGLLPITFQYKRDAQKGDPVISCSCIAEDAFNINPLFTYTKKFDEPPENALIESFDDDGTANVVEGLDETTILMACINDIKRLTDENQTLQANFEILQDEHAALLKLLKKVN